MVHSTTSKRVSFVPCISSLKKEEKKSQLCGEGVKNTARNRDLPPAGSTVTQTRRLPRGPPLSAQSTETSLHLPLPRPPLCLLRKVSGCPLPRSRDSRWGRSLCTVCTAVILTPRSHCPHGAKPLLLSDPGLPPAQPRSLLSPAHRLPPTSLNPLHATDPQALDDSSLRDAEGQPPRSPCSAPFRLLSHLGMRKGVTAPVYPVR